MEKNNIFSIILTVVILVSCSAEKKLMTYGVHYGKVNLTDIKGYDLVILEPENYSRQEILTLSQSKTKIIGYISMSEVNPYRWYYSRMKKIGFAGVNENWNSNYINLEDSTARTFITDTVATKIMEKGFDGLFLDTVDGVGPWSERKRMQDEMVKMIRELDRQFPTAYIIQNRGIFLLSKTASSIDAVMVEDVATLYDFDNKEYALKSLEEYRETVNWINSFADTLDKPILLLDYAVKDSLRQIVKSRLDTLEHPYFISNIELDTLPKIKD